MITGDMRCAYCGLTGKIDGYAAGPEEDAAPVFRYRGYNPVSGHAHYQCPSCAIVQLVVPLDIRQGKVATGFSGLAAGRGESFGRVAARGLERMNESRNTLPACALSGEAGLAERGGWMKRPAARQPARARQ